MLDEEDEDYKIPTAALSRKDKLCIWVVWVNSVILKPYGKSIPYSFLDYKIRMLWKLIGTLHLINLGHDFFLAHFQFEEDFAIIISSGHWFING